MKKSLIIVLLITLSIYSYSQCNVKTNAREDGVTVRYLSPDRIGNSDRLVLALSMQTDGENYYIMAVSLFENSAQKLKESLTIKFANNKSSTFQHYTSEINTYKGYPASISIFIVDKSALTNLSSSNISLAMVKLSDNVYQTVPVKVNADILVNQFFCLKK